MRRCLRHFATGESLDIEWDGGRIASIAPSGTAATHWIAPAFHDLQVNGFGGIGFTDRELCCDRIRTVADSLLSAGTSTFFPTVITAPFETLHASFAALRNCVESDSNLRSAMPGFHLEGPWISPTDGPRGAHPPDHVRVPNWDDFARLQDSAGGSIRLVTLAPELDGAIPFIERLVSNSVVVSLGHTEATAEQIAAAVDAGATMSTHLGNGLSRTIDRHRNPLWPQLAEDRLTASLIADGHHLPPDVLRAMIRAKGIDRCVLISDASTFAGSPPGHYRDWGSDIEVRGDGSVVLAGTPYLAGSGATLKHCVEFVLRQSIVTMPEAIRMASLRPRELFGLPVPEISVGSSGPFLVFEERAGDGHCTGMQTRWSIISALS